MVDTKISTTFYHYLPLFRTFLLFFQKKIVEMRKTRRQVHSFFCSKNFCLEPRKQKFLQQETKVSPAGNKSFLSTKLLFRRQETEKAPAERIRRGFVFALYLPFTGVGQQELYFITLVLILIACSPVAGYLSWGRANPAPTMRGQFKFIDYK